MFSTLIRIIVAQAKQSINLSLPIILSELAGSIGGFVGTLMVARLGGESLAALGLVNTTFIMLMASSWGVIMSVGVTVSHAYGAKNPQAIESAMGQGFWLAVVLSIFLLFLLMHATPILLALGQDPHIVAISQSYFDLVAIGILPGLCAGVLQQFVIAIKHSRAVMACTIFSVLFGISVNYVLIFGKLGMPALGLAGVGWGVIAVHCFMLLFMVAYVLVVRDCRRYRVFASIFRSNWRQLWELFSIGWPVGAMLGVEIGALLVAVLLCGLLGSASLAAYQIAIQCLITGIMIPWGLGQGTMVLVGHAVGAGDGKKAKEAGYVGMLLGTIATLLMAFVFWFFPTAVVKLFMDIHVGGNQPIVALVIPMLAVLGGVIFFDGMRLIASAALRGLKDTHLALMVGIISFWFIGLPIGYGLAFHLHWGAVGLWMGDLVGVTLGALVLIFWFRKQVEISDLFLKKVPKT